MYRQFLTDGLAREVSVMCQRDPSEQCLMTTSDMALCRIQWHPCIQNPSSQFAWVLLICNLYFTIFPSFLREFVVLTDSRHNQGVLLEGWWL